LKRSLKFSLNQANTEKLIVLEDLWNSYISVVNNFIDRLFNKEELSETFLKSLDSSLSYRYRQCAKRQAFKIYKSWCRNKKKGEKPILKGSMTLDYRFIELQKGRNSFDYWIKIATLEKGKPVLIPLKSYVYANKYFNEWNLVGGGRLIKNEKGWLVIFTFEKETPAKKKSGKVIGIDIGIKKLIVDSEGNEYGKGTESLIDKIQRKQQGSKTFKRALKERDYYVNKIIKEIPFADTKVIVLENIKDIKKDTKKKKRLNKQFRSKLQRWTYSKLISRVQQSCEVDGVHCQMIDPAYTSQTCCKCGFVHKLNRNGEMFKCRNCGYTLDADYNASLNILNLGLTQQAMVAGSTKGNICL